MNRRTIAPALFTACALAVATAGCYGARNDATGVAETVQTTPTPAAIELPEHGFKAQITLADPPKRLRAGQQVTLNVRVRNTSDVMWPAKRGEELKGVVAVANSWLDEKGTLLTNMDGRYGVLPGLAPGGEVELPLQITAPKEPGTYILELDMVQELVAFFKEKGNETLRVTVRVE